MASKSCAISVVVMTSSSKSWGHCYDVSTGEVASNSTWDTRRPYWLPLSIITFLLLFTRVVSHGHRMINHSLADTCKAHAHASCCDAAHVLPDTGCIGSIPALVRICCDTRQLRVFVIDHQSSSFHHIEWRLYCRADFSPSSGWGNTGVVSFPLLPCSDVWPLGGSHQSPTVDDS
ncbi:hypothetical protein EDD16DRAFT_1595767 [Pisolithus croceorrhizus]|nr:hypothetical protein EDD16DRAFT_1595767 [Pisolithus croceorrhizus]